MRNTTRRMLVMVVFMFSAFAIAAGQGLYWESTTTVSVMGEKTTHATTAYMPGMIKQHSAEGNSSTLILLNEERIIIINDKKKTYSEMTFAEMEASVKKAGGMMDEKMKEMEEAMKDLPEEQRKMMEQMMGGKLPGKLKDGAIEVTKGSSKTVSGFKCTEYKVTRDGKEFMTAWTTKDITGYGSMKKEVEEFSSRMAAMIPMVGKSISEGMEKIEGFPIQLEVEGKMKTTVTKLEARATPAKDFRIPEGYTKVEADQLKE